MIIFVQKAVETIKEDVIGMIKSAEAKINSALLIWARNTIAYDIEEAANKINIKPETLAKWESGEIKPTVKQLRKLANVYKRPLAAFYLDKPPKDFDVIKDYRRISADECIEKSPELLLEIRKAKYKRQLALQLADEANISIPSFELSARKTDNVEKLSEGIRDFWGINLKTQFLWKEKYEALRNWKNAFEKKGVLILQSSGIPVNMMRGFSISYNKLPVIVINGTDSPRGRIFTMMHELGHLIIHSEGLCNDFSYYRKGESEIIDTEVFCNNLAGNILVPSYALEKENIIRDRSQNYEWTNDDLIQLSNKYNVSNETILRRILLIGKTTVPYYKKKKIEFDKIYKELSEKKPEGFPPPDKKSIANNGMLLISLAFDAYYKNKIPVNKLTDYLDVKIKYLNNIEEYAIKNAISIGA